MRDYVSLRRLVLLCEPAMVVHDRVSSGDMRMTLFFYRRKHLMVRFQARDVFCKTPVLNLLSPHS